MYPSISICKKYAITNHLNVLTNVKEMAENDSDVPDIVRSNVTNSIQSLDEQLYFFTHPDVKNLTYPCTTTLGATTPGKPCIFPVYFSSNELWKGCKEWWTDRPVCFTKTDGEYCQNSTCIPYNDRNSWGYCDSSCKGESPEPSSKYNLAKSGFTDLWTSSIYDLNQWENGYCHTYNPPEKSGTDLIKRIFFMTAEIFDSWDNDFDIFLHEKGQFWPRKDMMSFGQPDSIQLEKGKELQIVFSVKEITKFNSKEKPCIIDNEEYSFTRCLQDFAVRKSNCSISIMKTGQDNDVCSVKAFENYFSLLTKLKSDQIRKIKKESGCYSKCKVRIFSYHTKENSISNSTKWMSEVFIQPKSSEVEYLEEYYNFDLQDLISSIGGYVGLFLGWSVLSLVEIFGGLLFFINVKKYMT